MNELLHTTYGSHLYGTNTPTSDIDLKVIYLPDFDDVLLGKKHGTFKRRFDEDGNPVSDVAKMPEGGTETEYVALQTFCKDFLDGQTYALEIAFAHVKNDTCPLWITELVDKFLTCNVASMAGFAKKQTFDYVHRGERYKQAAKLEQMLETIKECFKLNNADWKTSLHRLRLDEKASEGDALVILDILAAECGLKIGTTENNNKTVRTLELNGRSYLETTALEHLQTAVRKLIDQYGVRSIEAGKEAVDSKSLMHAVRVYQQALELLNTGKISFPRPNREQLLNIKQRATPMEKTRQLLLSLEAQLDKAQAVSTLQVKTPKLQDAFDSWLISRLRELYRL